MVRLLRNVMGLRVELEAPTTIELSLPSGDRVQVFAPGDPYTGQGGGFSAPGGSLCRIGLQLARSRRTQ
jgi:hypothetical protein